MDGGGALRPLFQANSYTTIKQQWNDPVIIQNYISKTHIQEGENKIIDVLKTTDVNLENMLDIGVGGGRTTMHFGHLFKKYTGVDIADKYHETLRERYPDYCFITKNILDCDFSEKFDFVFFSHNGIDYLQNITDYVQCIDKLFSLSRKYIAFSSHNFFYNGHGKQNIKYVSESSDHKIVEETGIAGSNQLINTIYTNPHFICNTLKKYPYKSLHIFNRDGKKIELTENNEELAKDQNLWLYYFIEI
mgnify:FL=1